MNTHFHKIDGVTLWFLKEYIYISSTEGMFIDLRERERDQSERETSIG